MCLSVPDGRPVFYPSRAFDDASRRRMRNRRCTPPSACKADRPGRAWGLAASSSAPRVRRRPPMLTCETTPPSVYCNSSYLSGKQRRRPGRSGFQRGAATCRRPTGGRPPMVGWSVTGDGRPLRASIQPVKRIPCLRRATECWRKIPLPRKARHFGGGGTGRDAETSASLFAEKESENPLLLIFFSLRILLPYKGSANLSLPEVPIWHFKPGSPTVCAVLWPSRPCCARCRHWCVPVPCASFPGNRTSQAPS